MLRTAVLLCAVVLMQVVTARAVPQHPACQSGCPDDGSDGGCAAGSDEALAAQRVEIVPPSPRLGRWHGPELAVAPSPTPDEILHVPKPLLA
jgi:hypothetical protein